MAESFVVEPWRPRATCGAKVEAAFWKAGDLGDAAAALLGKELRTKLSLRDVFERLNVIAHTAGAGTQERKIRRSKTSSGAWRDGRQSTSCDCFGDITARESGNPERAIEFSTPRGCESPEQQLCHLRNNASKGGEMGVNDSACVPVAVICYRNTVLPIGL